MNIGLKEDHMSFLLPYKLKREKTMPKTHPYEFKNHKGEVLSGKLEMPDEEPRAFAIFIHCFTGNKDFSANRQVSRRLRDLGIATLRFDFTGLGNSSGEFSDTNFSSNLDDVKAAYDALERDYQAPEIIIGHSLGGAAALATSNTLDKVNAIITIGAPSCTKHLTHHFDEHITEIMQQGQAQVDIAGRCFVITKQFLLDLQDDKVLNNVKKLRKALLIFHSPQDETVSIDHAKELYMNAHHPKSFISLDKADHLLTDKSDGKYVANIIASWCDRYISSK
jgi:putative redox protein